MGCDCGNNNFPSNVRLGAYGNIGYGTETTTGATGATGVSPLISEVTIDNIVIICDYLGSPLANQLGSNASSVFSVKRGAEAIAILSASITSSGVAISNSVSSGQMTINITSISADTGYVDIVYTSGTETTSKRINVRKLKQASSAASSTTTDSGTGSVIYTRTSGTNIICGTTMADIIDLEADNSSRLASDTENLRSVTNIPQKILNLF